MPTVVYLDDDRIQHLLMKKHLKIHLPQCGVEVFSQPENLVEWLQGNQADLILSDLNLEHESAWDWVEKFSSVSNAFLIFITAHISPEDRQKMDRFPQVKMIMEKPLSEENWQVISELISGSQSLE